MTNNNPYLSKDLLVNQISKEERLALKQSLLGKIIKIIVNPEYGLFTEHGFPVAIIAYPKERNRDNLSDFYAKVVEVNPMVTIDDIF